MQNILFLGGCAFFIIAFPAVFIYAIIQQRKKAGIEKKMMALLTEKGFSPISTPPPLINQVSMTPGEFTEIQKANIGGKDFYWYKKKMMMGNPGGESNSRPVIRREFLFPLRRSSDAPVVIVMAHFKAPQFIKDMFVGLLESALGHGMQHLEIPRELKDLDILAVFGDNKYDSVYRLINTDVLELLNNSPSQSIAIFYANEDHAAIGYDTENHEINPREFWEYVLKLSKC